MLVQALGLHCHYRNVVGVESEVGDFDFGQPLDGTGLVVQDRLIAVPDVQLDPLGLEFKEPGDGVGDDEDAHGGDEDPGLEVVPLAKEGEDDGDVPLDGEGHGGVDGAGERHLSDGHQERCQVNENPFWQEN